MILNILFKYQKGKLSNVMLCTIIIKTIYHPISSHSPPFKYDYCSLNLIHYNANNNWIIFVLLVFLITQKQTKQKKARSNLPFLGKQFNNILYEYSTRTLIRRSSWIHHQSRRRFGIRTTNYMKERTKKKVIFPPDFLRFIDVTQIARKASAVHQ